MKYYIIAGERSGDLHASNLVKALKELDVEGNFRGIGGDQMQEAGVDLAVHYNQIAVMGFLEVLKNYSRLKRVINETKQDVASYNPDVVLLVDAAGFNLRIAKFAKSLPLKVFYYISPKVWAWNQKRAYKIKRLVDKMFVILPFEKEFYKQFQYHVDYVGNPLFDAIRAFEPNLTFKEQVGMTDQPIIAVLPGSRKQEVLHILDIMLSIIPFFPNHQFVVAAVDNLPKTLYEKVKGIDRVSTVFNRTYDLLSVAEAAVVTSGTASLETALFKVPHVVCYKTSGFTYAIAKSLIKVNFISLVNLIADREVVKELIQGALTTDNLKHSLKSILPEGANRSKVLNGYEEVYEILGDKKASQNTARLVVKYLSE